MSQRYLCLLAFAVGCGDNVTTVVRVDAENPGGNCQYGGLAVSTGLDRDRDGTLDPNEISSTQYVCNGGVTVKCGAADTVHDGSVTIRTASDFAQLDGVSCVDGGLIIAGIDGELAALPALTTVTGGLIIAGNEDITSLAGFSGLRKVGQTYLVQGNASLTDISTLGDLESAQSIELVGNDSLADLAGFSKVTTLPYSLGVSNNSALTSLHGLENVLMTTQSLTFRGNRALNDISGLQNLRSVALIDLSSNPSLQAINLPNLRQVDVRFLITDNATLTSVAAPQLISMQDSMEIVSNPKLTSVSVPSLLTIGVVRVENDTLLSSIDAHSLAYVTADLVFSSLTSLTNADFSDLKAVGGTVRVYLNNPFSFAKFTSLGEVGNLWLVSTSNLTDFAGLTALTKIEGNLTVSANPQLTSFAGLDNMATIGGNVTITDNASLSHATVQAFLARVSVAGTTTAQ